jgi:hypothetical protein
MGTVAEFRSAASDLVARSFFARWAGKTFGGKRNVDEALGYLDDLTLDDYRHRYERGGIAGRVVDAKPESTWRETGDLVESQDPKKTTPFEEAWRELNLRLNIWATFFNTDTIAGLGRYAVILIGAPGKINEPMPSTLPAKNIAYLRAFAEDEAKIEDADLIKDTASPRFAYPNFYTIKAMQIGGQGTSKVHHTRCLHVRAEGVPDGPLYGPPRLRKPWNYLDDLVKVVGGGAEAFWIRANQGYVFNLDKEAKLEESEKTKMRDQLEEFEHGMRRALRLQGVETKILGSDVADFGGPATSILSLIAATTGIPQRLLLGSERGEQASTQDRENWSDRIDGRRTQYAFPFIIKPFIDRLIELKALPAPAQYTVRWPDMLTLTEGEKGDIAVKMSTVNKNMGEIVVTGDEIRDRVWGWEPIAKIDSELDARQREKRGKPAPAPTPAPREDDDALPRAATQLPLPIAPPAAPIHVHVPPSTINVHVPPAQSAPTQAKVLEYDKSGRITRITPITEEASK